MSSPRALPLLLLVSAFTSACALPHAVRTHDAREAVWRVHEQHLEVHRLHHQMGIDAHEAAMRLHAQLTQPPPPPPPITPPLQP